MVLKATVNCDMGEGFSLYTIGDYTMFNLSAGSSFLRYYASCSQSSVGDDAALMPLIHLANVACGFHAR